MVGKKLEILILKKEVEGKMILKKPSIYYSKKHSMGKRWKMFVIGKKYRLLEKMVMKNFLHNNQN